MKQSLSEVSTIVLLVVAALAVSGCGPVFAIKNDTDRDVYSDAISPSAPRDLAPQVLARRVGAISYPTCWKDIGALYLGYAPGKLEKKAYAKLCNPSKCSCTVTVTQLEDANR